MRGAERTGYRRARKLAQGGDDQPRPDEDRGDREEGMEIDLSFDAALVEASLNGLMAYDAGEDEYEYLKQQAKKLGVNVSVDKDPFGDGYDELNYSGDKAAILKLASISGHDQDITGGPDEGGYWITETVSDKPKTIELNDDTQIDDRVWSFVIKYKE